MHCCTMQPDTSVVHGQMHLRCTSVYHSQAFAQGHAHNQEFNFTLLHFTSEGAECFAVSLCNMLSTL